MDKDKKEDKYTLKKTSIRKTQLIASLFGGAIEGGMAFYYTKRYLINYQEYQTYWDYCNVAFYSDKFNELEYISPLSVELLFMPMLLFLTAIFIVCYQYFIEKKDYYEFVAIRCSSQCQYHQRLRGNPCLVTCVYNLLYLLVFHFLIIYQGIACNGHWKLVIINFFGVWIERTLLATVVCNIIHLLWNRYREIAMLVGILLILIIYCIDFMLHLHVIYYYSTNYLYLWTIGLVIINGGIHFISKRLLYDI